MFPLSTKIDFAFSIVDAGAKGKDREGIIGRKPLSSRAWTKKRQKVGGFRLSMAGQKTLNLKRRVRVNAGGTDHLHAPQVAFGQRAKHAGNC